MTRSIIHDETGQHRERNQYRDRPRLQEILDALDRSDIGVLLMNDISRTSRADGIRAAIYIRVAVDDYQSAQSQETICREYASGRGYSVIDLYSDVGRSGNGDLPGLNMLMGAAQRQEFDVVITADRARIARNVESSVNVSTTLVRSGVRIELAVRQ